eukprot:PhF_6_TR37604/c0_g1_i2/m.55851
MVLLHLVGDPDIFAGLRGRTNELIWSVEPSKPFFVSLPALMRILQMDYRPGPNFPFDLFTVTPNGAPGQYIDVQSATPQGLLLKGSDKIYVSRRIPGRLVFSPTLPSTPVLARTKLSIRCVLLDSHNREMAFPPGSRVTLSTTPLECLVTQNLSLTVPVDTPIPQLPTNLVFGAVALSCVIRPRQNVELIGSVSGPGIGPQVQRAEGVVQVTTEATDSVVPALSTTMASPSIIPPAGTYPYGICIVIGDGNDNPSDLIVFTADGSDPAASGVRYVGPFYVNACGPLTIKALRVSTNNQICSPVNRADYYLTPSKPAITADVSMGPQGEAVLSIADKPPREGTLEMRYTVDGTLPTPYSALYSAPIRLSEIASGTLKACTVWVPTASQRKVGVVHALSEPATLNLFPEGSRPPPTNPSDIPYIPYHEPPCPLPVPSTYRKDPPKTAAGPTPPWALRHMSRTSLPQAAVTDRLEKIINMICAVRLTSSISSNAHMSLGI